MTILDLSEIISPAQKPIHRESIIEMITWVPRRSKLSTQWPNPIHEPRDKDSDWSLVLPFCETLSNSFITMCDVNTIGLREGKGRCYTFIKDAKDDPEDLIKVKNWLDIIGNYVAIRDCLALCFALDYDREEGDPDKTQTIVGVLRSRAKPYGGEKPTSDTFAAADKLMKVCLEFIDKVDCYKYVDVVAAMPPSDPTKSYNLPAYITSGIDRALNKPDLTEGIKTISPRSGLKEVALENKLSTLEGTIEVDQNLFKGQVVLLIDDLYQSGVSINYAAMLLLEAGAKKIFGLACEKTCSNDDNVRRKVK
jgi:hypothetical protein